jgi:hypothetical protein
MMGYRRRLVAQSLMMELIGRTAKKLTQFLCRRTSALIKLPHPYRTLAREYRGHLCGSDLLNRSTCVRKIESLWVTTEERERLLLLPDYLAGILHAANSASDTLSRSQVSSAMAKRAHERLKAELRFNEFDGTTPLNYFDIFPDFAKYKR